MIPYCFSYRFMGNELNTTVQLTSILLAKRCASIRRCTVGQINESPRRKYMATCSSVCSFAHTAHSFACSTLLASLPCSLCSLPRSWDSEWLDGYFVCVPINLDHSASFSTHNCQVIAQEQMPLASFSSFSSSYSTTTTSSSFSLLFPPSPFLLSPLLFLQSPRHVLESLLLLSLLFV